LKKIIFDLLTSPLNVSDNYLIDYIIMAMIGFVAFKMAFKIVGDTGIRGEVGSILHWSIRCVLFLLLWFLCSIIISVVKYVTEHTLLSLILFSGVIVAICLLRLLFNFVCDHCFSKKVL